jgi:hypothetical protein
MYPTGVRTSEGLWQSRGVHRLAEVALNDPTRFDPPTLSRLARSPSGLGEALLRAGGALSRFQALRNALELEGYEFRDGALLHVESDVLDPAETSGVVQDLYKALDVTRSRCRPRGAV